MGVEAASPILNLVEQFAVLGGVVVVVVDVMSDVDARIDTGRHPRSR